jgi:hypothetical protein
VWLLKPYRYGVEVDEALTAGLPERPWRGGLGVLVGGDRPRGLAARGRVGLAGRVRGREPEPAKSGARQLDGAAAGGKSEETNEGSRKESSHAKSGFLDSH